jgi:YidC/Oxa1 family membrane protein insertase
MIRVGLSRSFRSGSSVLSIARTISRENSPILMSKLVNVRFNSTNATKLVISEIKDTLPLFEDDIKPISDMTSDQLGYLDSIGLAQGWGPTSIIERILEVSHVYTGLPWWGSIIVATIGIRFLMFPLYMKASANAAKTSKVKPELDAVLTEMKSAQSPQEQFMAASKRKKLMIDNDIHMSHQMFPVLQLPIAYGFFQALRKMANFPVEGFSTGGTAWFEDLTQVDPYLGLQIIGAALVLGIVRLGGETGMSTMSKPMKKLLTILPIASIFITKEFSAAVVLYFAVNSLFSFMQTLILGSKWFRKLTNMPSFVKREPLPGAKRAPETFGDLFNDFTEKSKDTAITQARKTNDKLNAIERRKAAASGSFVKRKRETK